MHLGDTWTVAPLVFSCPIRGAYPCGLFPDGPLCSTTSGCSRKQGKRVTETNKKASLRREVEKVQVIS